MHLFQWRPLQEWFLTLLRMRRSVPPPHARYRWTTYMYDYHLHNSDRLACYSRELFPRLLTNYIIAASYHFMWDDSSNSVKTAHRAKCVLYRGIYQGISRNIMQWYTLLALIYYTRYGPFAIDSIINEKKKWWLQQWCPSVQLKNVTSLDMSTTEAKFTSAVVTHMPWSIREDKQWWNVLILYYNCINFAHTRVNELMLHLYREKDKGCHTLLSS